jgi:hypothetical protein
LDQEIACKFEKVLFEISSICKKSLEINKQVDHKCEEPLDNIFKELNCYLELKIMDDSITKNLI